MRYFRRSIDQLTKNFVEGQETDRAGLQLQKDTKWSG